MNSFVVERRCNFIGIFLQMNIVFICSTSNFSVWFGLISFLSIPCMHSAFYDTFHLWYLLITFGLFRCTNKLSIRKIATILWKWQQYTVWAKPQSEKAPNHVIICSNKNLSRKWFLKRIECILHDLNDQRKKNGNIRSFRVPTKNPIEFG